MRDSQEYTRHPEKLLFNCVHISEKFLSSCVHFLVKGRRGGASNQPFPLCWLAWLQCAQGVASSCDHFLNIALIIFWPFQYAQGTVSYPAWQLVSFCFIDSHWARLEKIWQEIYICILGKQWFWQNVLCHIPDVCLFFSTSTIFGSTFLHTKVRKSRQNRLLNKTA